MTPEHIQIVAAVMGVLVLAGGVVWGVIRGARSVTADYVTKQVCQLMHQAHAKELQHIEDQITRLHVRVDGSYQATEALALKVINGRRHGSSPDHK